MIAEVFNKVKILMKPEFRIRQFSAGFGQKSQRGATEINSLKQAIVKIRTELDLGRSVDRVGGLLESEELAYIVDYTLAIGISLTSTLKVLEKVLDDILELEQAKATALAAPKATVKLLRFLPIVGVGLGFLLGVNPLRILLLNPIGVGALVIGVTFAWCGSWWSNRVVRDFERLTKFKFCSDPRVQLALIGAGVRSGASLAHTIQSLGVAGSENLLVGVPFRFAGLPESLECLEDAYTLGSSPIPVIGAKIQEYQRQTSEKYRTGAEKLAVELVIPLGLCYLPSFICIGVVPVILAFLLG
jgi:tight adherence protein B